MANTPRQRLPLALDTSTAVTPDADLSYVVARSVGDLQFLNREVSRLMRLGFMPHGALVVAACFDRAGAFIVEYYQPMVRTRPVVPVG